MKNVNSASPPHREHRTRRVPNNALGRAAHHRAGKTAPSVSGDDNEIRCHFLRRRHDLIVGHSVPDTHGNLRRIRELLMRDLLEFGADQFAAIRRRGAGIIGSDPRMPKLVAGSST